MEPLYFRSNAAWAPEILFGAILWFLLFRSNAAQAPIHPLGVLSISDQSLGDARSLCSVAGCAPSLRSVAGVAQSLLGSTHYLGSN